MKARTILAGKLAGLKCRVVGKCGAKRTGVAAKLAAKFRAKRRKGEPTCGGDSDGACSAGPVCGIILVCLMIGAGCATQPSRSQNMVVRDNTINVFVSPRLPAVAVGETNAVPAGAVGGDVLAQNMMIENSGTETQSPTASADSALNLPVGDTAVSALGELIGASISGAFKTAGKTDAAAAGP
jgi:hypothetical protein